MAQPRAGTSSAKKLVQACLPFKPLDSPHITQSSNCSATKKRRLTDGAICSNRSTKSLKREENRKPGKQLDCSTDDKEVSSSCEMSVGCTRETQMTKAASVWKSTNPLDHFIRTAQQLAVSTSCEEGDIIDLTEADDENIVVTTSVDVSSNCKEGNGYILADCSLKLNTSSTTADDCLQSLKLDNNMNEGVENCNINGIIVTKKSVVSDRHACNDILLPSQPCKLRVDEKCHKSEAGDKLSGEDVDVELDISDENAVKCLYVAEGLSEKGCLVAVPVVLSGVDDTGADAGPIEACCSLVSKTVVEPGVEVATIDETGLGDKTLLQTVGSSCEQLPMQPAVDAITNNECSTDLLQQTTAGSCVNKAEQFTAESFSYLVPEKTEVSNINVEFGDCKLDILAEQVTESADDSFDIKCKQGKGRDKHKKKLDKKTEKDRIYQERKKLRDEKEKCRLIEKEKREQEKLEAKLSKERERQEKEKERVERKKQKEDERLQKLELLQEEKKKKEEAKLEEKKKKEEKKDKQDEKVLKEKELMQRFFVPVKEISGLKSQDIKIGPFMEFEVKDNMRLAPLRRIDTVSAIEAAKKLDKHLVEHESVPLYLDELKSGVIRPRTSAPTWPCQESDVTIVSATSSSACFMHAKLLQFHDNNRPAYYGTWRKRSLIINPRNPLHCDTSVFDYEVDSDDEWEEEEPGESLSHSEDDDDDEPETEQDEEGDGFFVPHGYLSEGEGCEDDDDELEISPEKRKARQLARASKWETDIKKKSDVLQPIVIGISWCNPSAVCDPLLSKLQEFKVILFEKAPIATDCPADESSDGKLEMSDKKAKSSSYTPVPETALSDLARLVHGNEWSIKKLVREFSEFWYRKVAVDQSNGDVSGKKCMISKVQLKRKIQEIAVYELRPQYSRRKLWYVSDDTLNTLNLSDLPVPTAWQWITKLPSKAPVSTKKVCHLQLVSLETADKPAIQLCSIKSFMTSKNAEGDPVKQAPVTDQLSVLPTSADVREHPNQVNKLGQLKDIKHGKRSSGPMRRFASPVCASIVCDDARIGSSNSSVSLHTGNPLNTLSGLCSPISAARAAAFQPVQAKDEDDCMIVDSSDCTVSAKN